MDERLWTDRALAEGEVITTAGCRVSRVRAGFQTLVSGDLTAAISMLAPDTPLLGFAEVSDTPRKAIRIARDHALLVTSNPVQTDMGWHDAGFALSDAGDRFACLDLAGPGAMDVLAHGMASAPPVGSPSAALYFAGLPVLATGTGTGLNLWVDQGNLTYLTGFIAHIGRTADSALGA